MCRSGFKDTRWTLDRKLFLSPSRHCLPGSSLFVLLSSYWEWKKVQGNASRKTSADNVCKIQYHHDSLEHGDHPLFYNRWVFLCRAKVFVRRFLWMNYFSNWSPFFPHGMTGMWAGVGQVFFSYIGFDSVSTLAGEVKVWPFEFTNSHVEETKQRFASRSASFGSCCIHCSLGIVGTLLVVTLLYITVGLVLTGMVNYAVEPAFWWSKLDRISTRMLLLPTHFKLFIKTGQE